jgi:hypothetical protein
MLPLHGGAARLASTGGGSSGQQQQFSPDAASVMFVPVRPLCCCIRSAACYWAAEVAVDEWQHQF